MPSFLFNVGLPHDLPVISSAKDKCQDNNCDGLKC